ncbi:type II toxin-antitoxin system RelE family toxin [Desulfogranum marinum]|uniref:type II toxin-antitoxin system RelE family toxin n=1 Tax=Desulfogranum marinum TaxID=453220 RepID=UPI001965C1A9|nr:type II toxin-antitoxin system RelE/ParE family toxin [Desulfogranum marinum]
MVYTVEFRPSVWKNVKNIPKKDLVKIKSKIDEMCSSLPDPTTTKMSGNNAFHKIRYGNYRIIYEIHEDCLVILIVKAGYRKDVYRNL